jgi:hypothetical protein
MKYTICIKKLTKTTNATNIFISNYGGEIVYNLRMNKDVIKTFYK